MMLDIYLICYNAINRELVVYCSNINCCASSISCLCCSSCPRRTSCLLVSVSLSTYVKCDGNSLHLLFYHSAVKVAANGQPYCILETLQNDY